MKSSLPRVLAALAVLALPAAPAFAADTYKIDPTHTSVIWSANHMKLSKPHGIFPMVEGTITVDEAAIANSKVDVTIKPGLVVTGNEKFDAHLRNTDFFNVEKFPSATFKSTKVVPTGDKTAKVTGDLTLLGVTKPVTLDVTLNHKGEHPMTKKQAIGFSATGTIKRSEFGINYAVPNVSDEVPLIIEAEASL